MRTALKCVTTNKTSDHPTDCAAFCAWQKREAVCWQPNVVVTHMHDTRNTMHTWPDAMYLFHFDLLSYSNVVYARSTRHKEAEQRMNETNEKREKTHFFPGGHIIADSESASAYASMQPSSSWLLSVFIQLASSPPRLHFPVACCTKLWRGRYQSKL